MIPQSKPGNRLSVHVGDQQQQRQSNHLRRVGEGPLCPTKDSVNEFLQFYFAAAQEHANLSDFQLSWHTPPKAEATRSLRCCTTLKLSMATLFWNVSPAPTDTLLCWPA
jgi:hypothetical protein